jgi:CheY-like chemotaxis protein
MSWAPRMHVLGGMELESSDDEEEEADRSDAASAVSTNRASARTLLYVDDNAANVRLVDLLLEQRPGVRLLSADSGRLGLELARQHRPDVILLDMHLPDIQGIDFLRTIRQEPLLARTPVIVVSAEDDRQSPLQMIAAGAQVYLTKPLNLFEFFAALDAVLPRVEP